MYTDLDTDGDRRSRAEAAYVDLKRRLLFGEFPMGDRLGEERLAALLGVSRTPVREALTRLHVEGLVERHPEGGFRPAPPDLVRTAELYQVRFALEFHALRLPGQMGTEHDPVRLRELREEWVALDIPAGGPVDPSFVLLDEDFHVRLADAAGNRALVEVLASVNERIRLVRMHDFLTAERVATTVEQHVGILDALLAGDAIAAEAALGEHLEQSLQIAEERAAAALARMVSRRADIGDRP